MKVFWLIDCSQLDFYAAKEVCDRVPKSSAAWACVVRFFLLNARSCFLYRAFAQTAFAIGLVVQTIAASIYASDQDFDGWDN